MRVKGATRGQTDKRKGHWRVTTTVRWRGLHRSDSSHEADRGGRTQAIGQRGRIQDMWQRQKGD